MPVLQNSERLFKLHEFISVASANCDSQQQHLLACVAESLNTLCNPERLVQESAELRQLDLSALKL